MLKFVSKKANVLKTISKNGPQIDAYSILFTVHIDICIAGEVGLSVPKSPMAPTQSFSTNSSAAISTGPV